jgi:hypothetical protein
MNLSLEDRGHCDPDTLKLHAGELSLGALRPIQPIG